MLVLQVAGGKKKKEQGSAFASLGYGSKLLDPGLFGSARDDLDCGTPKQCKKLEKARKRLIKKEKRAQKKNKTQSVFSKRK